MDLEELGCAYEGAARQVGVLDTCLAELLQRQGETGETTEAEEEFGYLDFKIDVVAGVKQMYEVFRDKKWNQLQHEAARSLQEVLTPPTGPAQHQDAPTRTWEEEELLVHEIPVPVTPLDDTETWGEDLRVPGYTVWGNTDLELDTMAGFSRD